MYRRHCAWLAIALVSSPAAFAADQCVNPGGSGGCLSSINAAIAAAGPNDTVRVAHGTYAENVVIDKPLALLGESEANTVIDATDLANGIDIDGHGHPGLGHVIVKDFKVANANFQGILVTDATDVTVTDACLVLGYYAPDRFFGGRRRLSIGLALRALFDAAGLRGVQMVAPRSISA